MIRHLLTVAAMLLLLPACTLSNRVFEEDQLFIEAVPVQEDLRTEHPSSRDVDGDLVDADGARDVGDPAVVPPVAREIATTINSLVFLLLEVIDRVMDEPITTREVDGRTWGPYPHPNSGGSARLVVTRDPDDPAFFEYVAALTAAPPDELTDQATWDHVISGQFARDAGSLREGSGSFCWDADLHAAYHPAFFGGGLMCASHRRTGDRIRLQVTFEDWLQVEGDRRDIEYFFDHREDLGGVLEYVAEDDWVGAPGSALETSATRVRWLRAGAGRADMTFSGGDLPEAGVPATECWGYDLARVYYFVDMPGNQPDVVEGSEGDCVFADREDVQEIG